MTKNTNPTPAVGYQYVAPDADCLRCGDTMLLGNVPCECAEPEYISIPDLELDKRLEQLRQQAADVDRKVDELAISRNRRNVFIRKLYRDGVSVIRIAGTLRMTRKAVYNILAEEGV